MSKSTEYYVADFETDNSEYAIKNKSGFVWLAGIAPIYDDTECAVFTTIDDFMDHCSKLGHITVFFHNLEFDGRCIWDWALKCGLQIRKKELKDNLLTLSVEGYDIIFRDSFPIARMSIEKMGEYLGEEHHKLDMDYSIDRRGYIPTEDDISYIKRDLDILRRFMRMLTRKQISLPTIGSIAVDICKDILNEFYTFKDDVLLVNEVGEILQVKDGHIMSRDGIIKDDIYHKRYSLSTLCESAYKGGYNLAINGTYKNCVIVDVNRLYPYIASYCKVPVGDVVQHGFPDEIQYDPNLCTMYQIALDFDTFNRDVRGTWVTEYDLDGLEEYYITYVVQFNSGNPLRELNLDLYKKSKEKYTDGGYGLLAKMIQNNIIGKMGTKKYQTSSSRNIEDGKITKLTSQREVKTYYRFLPIFVNSIGRYMIRRCIEAFNGKVVYTDTDSLIVRDTTVEEVSETLRKLFPNSALGYIGEDFGNWKVVADNCEVVVFGQKKYKYRNSEIEKVVASGLNTSATYDEFVDGATLKIKRKNSLESSIFPYIEYHDYLVEYSEKKK